MSKESKRRIDRYYWNGYLGSYEVKEFEYDEEREVLTLYTHVVKDFEYIDDDKGVPILYTYADVKEVRRTIVELSYADSHVKLETFTDEEINEHLLETYEEYVYKGEYYE